MIGDAVISPAIGTAMPSGTICAVFGNWAAISFRTSEGFPPETKNSVLVSLMVAVFYSFALVNIQILTVLVI